MERQRKDLYEIRDLVGEGAFGHVYKAIDNNSGLPMALKEIRIESE